MAFAFCDAFASGAQEVEPSYVLTFQGEDYAYLWEVDGATYVYGQVDRYCGCEVSCVIEEFPTPSPTDPTPNPEPTPTPEPTPSPEPEPDPEACNRGGGNGPEDCDPGNSGGKPGNAGEQNE